MLHARKNARETLHPRRKFSNSENPSSEPVMSFCQYERTLFPPEITLDEDNSTSGEMLSRNFAGYINFLVYIKPESYHTMSDHLGVFGFFVGHAVPVCEIHQRYLGPGRVENATW